MDTICEKKPADTTVTLFGKEFPTRFCRTGRCCEAALGEKYTDQEYNEILLAGCMEGGIAAFTGDGSDARGNAGSHSGSPKNWEVWESPTVKPWDMDTIRDKMELVKRSGALLLQWILMRPGFRFFRI